jgi:hypothetical protein
VGQYRELTNVLLGFRVLEVKLPSMGDRHTITVRCSSSYRRTRICSESATVDVGDLERDGIPCLTDVTVHWSIILAVRHVRNFPECSTRTLGVERNELLPHVLVKFGLVMGFAGWSKVHGPDTDRVHAAIPHHFVRLSVHGAALLCKTPKVSFRSPLKVKTCAPNVL